MAEATAETKSPATLAFLHERLSDGPEWLAGLLRHKNPDTITATEASAIRAKIVIYARGASANDALRPITLVLEETLLQIFDDWSHRVTRLRYQEYLQSDGWDRVRGKVLDRAKYICEGCGERRATQVHHLTYEDPRGEEMLFNLVALCRDCHEKITKRQEERGHGVG